MTNKRNTIKAAAFMLALALSGCGVNPFSIDRLTNNIFANVMVAFLKNLGVPVGTEKRPEGESTQQLAKMSARTLAKVAAGEQEFDTLTVAEAETLLKEWLSDAYVTANRTALLQSGDIILTAEVANDTDNFEVKTGTVIVNIGAGPVTDINQFRFWSFKGHNTKIQINGYGDKFGEESDVSGLVFIPSTDRRIYWKGVVTKEPDGVKVGEDEYNVGDSGVAVVGKIEYSDEDGDWVQYGSMDYWDQSRSEENKDPHVMGIEVKIYHNNTTQLDDFYWSDNKAETHFPLTDEFGGVDKQYFIVAMHYGEYNPEKAKPYEFREEGAVFKSRTCRGGECSIKNGYDYGDIYIRYTKPRGNGKGQVTFYDEDGEVIDQRTADGEAK